MQLPIGRTNFTHQAELKIFVEILSCGSVPHRLLEYNLAGKLTAISKPQRKHRQGQIDAIQMVITPISVSPRSKAETGKYLTRKWAAKAATTAHYPFNPI